MARDNLIRQISDDLRLALDGFLLDAEARGLRPKTLSFYREQIGAFLSFVAGDGARSLSDISPDTIRAYLVALQRRGLSSASVRTSARALRVWFNYLVTEKDIVSSPMVGLKLPTQDPPDPDAFTPDEIKRLLAAAGSPRDRAVILCLLDTGCRASEFVSWCRGDIDLATGAVTVRQEATKGRRTRTVYLGVKARKAMLKHLRSVDNAPDAPVWTSETRGGQLNANGLFQLLQRIGKRAGIERTGPHKFRRTFAVMFLRGGGDLYTLQRLMGHSSLDMLKHYLGLVESDLRDAHKRAGPVDRI